MPEVKNNNVSIKYTGKEFSVTNKSPLFSTAKVYVMYHGENRNNSTIEKSNVDSAIESIYNIPIVGEFLESDNADEKSNFGSHGGKVVIDDNGMKFIQTTKPIGVVPESANVYWEKSLNEKEEEKEYLVIDGALVWNRYEDEVQTLRDANFGQSMEIEVNDGWFDGESGNYHITDFSFSALCILGIDGRKNGEVEPAFEGSKIITYSKDMVVDELKEMRKDLKKFYTLDTFEKEENKLDLKDDKELEKLESEKAEDKKVEDEKSEAKSEEGKEESKEPEVIQTETEGRAGDVIENKEEAKEREETSGTLEGETAVDADLDAREIADAHIDVDATNEFAQENESLKGEIAKLNEELAELREFKKEVDKHEHEQKAIEMFEKMGLVDDDVNELDIYAFSIEELEEKCYVILGKKAVKSEQKFSLEDNREEAKKSNKVSLSRQSKEKVKRTYGSLFEKYGNKE